MTRSSSGRNFQLINSLWAFLDELFKTTRYIDPSTPLHVSSTIWFVSPRALESSSEVPNLIMTMHHNFYISFFRVLTNNAMTSIPEYAFDNLPALVEL